MKRKRDQEAPFPWNLLFIITAISFLIFGAFIKLIDGNSGHVAIFLKIGIVSLALFFISLIASSAIRSSMHD